MEIKDILSPDCTSCAVQGTSKKRILETISLLAAEKINDIDQTTILNSLVSREKMGSTGIGNGIALPHGRLSGLKDVVAILLTSAPSISFDAIDNCPVDIFFAIFVPEDKAAGHLQTLATIASKLSDKEILKRIRGAESDAQLYEAIIT
ncbi:PTS IIA-like nitrogen regulatory protein PtsN [Aliiglaciecola lipolytica]|uniref:PTS system, nitrogen regulatory IIA component n=1 Tax=Aliiglaciecola lipolytica E3 TaxID=1127673 RepID=K6YEL3_9ALTE|nr:PTS IIA-like nitrogen regulatory protein PtsN [Aliiglaciecola lipolytica]GAC15078.1 PTS system, nitrogen regulatory IIA component [Aliiglaciecola lipolytica E3]